MALGTGLLGVSKIVEKNMELGHNVMHGQFDWLNDPSLNGTNYDWDTMATGPDWKHTHNYIHHTYTNIVGMDHDIVWLSPCERCTGLGTSFFAESAFSCTVDGVF